MIQENLDDSFMDIHGTIGSALCTFEIFENRMLDKMFSHSKQSSILFSQFSKPLTSLSSEAQTTICGI